MGLKAAVTIQCVLTRAHIFMTFYHSFGRNNTIQPMQLGMDGKIREMTQEDQHNPMLQPEKSANSDSDDEV